VRGLQGEGIPLIETQRNTYGQSKVLAPKYRPAPMATRVGRWLVEQVAAHSSHIDQHQPHEPSVAQRAQRRTVLAACPGQNSRRETLPATIDRINLRYGKTVTKYGQQQEHLEFIDRG